VIVHGFAANFLIVIVLPFVEIGVKVAFTLSPDKRCASINGLRSVISLPTSHTSSALKASVELILESLGDVPQSELGRLLRSIHYSVAGLQTLIDNLLESASIESGHFRIRPREARLSDVIGEAARIMAPLLQRREQGLQIEMDWSLPPLSLDPTRITQVIVNLLSNASKYSQWEKGFASRCPPQQITCY
jgi:two-component system sensor histidine kinase EvgS